MVGSGACLSPAAGCQPAEPCTRWTSLLLLLHQVASSALSLVAPLSVRHGPSVAARRATDWAPSLHEVETMHPALPCCSRYDPQKERGAFSGGEPESDQDKRQRL